MRNILLLIGILSKVNNTYAFSASSTRSSIKGHEQQQQEQEQEQFKTVSFPILNPSTTLLLHEDNDRKDSQLDQNIDESDRFIQWYDQLIETTPYFIRSETQKYQFIIPIFDNAEVSLSLEDIKDDDNNKEKNNKSYQSYQLKIKNINQNDFGMLCARLYESQKTNGIIDFDLDEVIDTSNLLHIVRETFRKQRPHPGYDAELYRLEDNVLKELLLTNDDDNTDDKNNDLDGILRQLQDRGFVTIDTSIKTNTNTNDKLSTFLKKKTKQDSTVRSDTVAFLSKDDAFECGLQSQYESLMGLSSLLNDELGFERSSFEALVPGTKEKPLTNPQNIQAAEYSEGEFYVAHSDNLMLDSNVRSNYRLYTCILYCNDDWDMHKDGGALRIYPNSIHLTDPSDAIKNQMEYEDVNPTNGKLLIFDSRLVHSVEQVTSKTKKRRALTLWLMRPEDSGVHIDLWDEEKGQVDWYRLF